MIRFGWWSTTLAIAEAFGLLVALLLLVASTNRVAGRLLAALMLVAALRLTPYALGFAGVYDAAPWLTFAPFDPTFAAGPLLWLYLRRLATPVLPRSVALALHACHSRCRLSDLGVFPASGREDRLERHRPRPVDRSGGIGR